MTGSGAALLVTKAGDVGPAAEGACALENMAMASKLSLLTLFKKLFLISSSFADCRREPRSTISLSISFSLASYGLIRVSFYGIPDQCDASTLLGVGPAASHAWIVTLVPVLTEPDRGLCDSSPE